MVVTDMGNFTYSNGLQLNSEFRYKTAIKHRMNMQGITLKVNCVILEKLEEPLEVLLFSRDKPSREYLTRVTYSLLDIIKDMFNLT
jgi:hypothetical protein